MAASGTHLDISATFGAMFVGSLVTMTVYGITTLQAYFYYTSYPNDGIGLKTLVGVIWTLDTFHVVLMCYTMYHYLISGFGNAQYLVEGIWSLYLSIAVNVFIAFLVQCFFTRRIFSLSSERVKWWISGIIGFTVFAHFFFGIETVVFFFIKKEFARLSEANFYAVLPFAVMAILSDIFIAGALCFLLARSRSDFEDTNNIINKLIVYAINRCVLTSAVAIIEVVVFVARPRSFSSFAFDFVIGKLYANSFLATLNSRRSLQNQNKGTPQTTGQTTGTSTSMSFRLASVAQPDQRESTIRTPGRVFRKDSQLERRTARMETDEIELEEPSNWDPLNGVEYPPRHSRKGSSPDV